MEDRQPTFENPVSEALGTFSTFETDPQKESSLRTHKWKLRKSNAIQSSTGVGGHNLPFSVSQGTTWWDCPCGAVFCETIEAYNPLDSWYWKEFYESGGKRITENSQEIPIPCSVPSQDIPTKT